MLKINLILSEQFDNENQEFITDSVELELEHSLVSLSKWESIWEKPFLKDDDRSDEETLSYIEQMVLTPNPPPDFVQRLTQADISAISDYISAKRSATWFSNNSQRPVSRITITSELIYSWMVEYNIPFECQYWHLSRLFTLIRVLQTQHEKPKKMSRSEIATRNRELNEQRRRKYNTNG